MSPQPPTYAEVVRAHHAKTTAFLLASQPDCERLRSEEVQRVRRRLVPVDLTDLQGFAPRGSWLLAVLLCPGDDAQAVAAWAVGLKASDRDRVRFYYRRRPTSPRPSGHGSKPA